MARPCSICVHPARAAIDQALASGDSTNRRIASRYGVIETSLRRHQAAHLGADGPGGAPGSPDLGGAAPAAEPPPTPALAIAGEAQGAADACPCLAALAELRTRCGELRGPLAALHRQAWRWGMSSQAETAFKAIASCLDAIAGGGTAGRGEGR